jgi:hypothetical protein
MHDIYYRDEKKECHYEQTKFIFLYERRMSEKMRERHDELFNSIFSIKTPKSVIKNMAMIHRELSVGDDGTTLLWFISRFLIFQKLL